jgi:integral membrane protein
MKLLRFMALLEGSSLLLLLLVAVPLKRLMGIPEAVQIIGPLHGLLFMAFNALLIAAMLKKQLTIKQYVLGFIASLIPVGTFIYKVKVLNQIDTQ